MIIVLLGASGSGKSTLESKLAEKHNFEKIVSYTTREKRDYEVNNKDYVFTSCETFNDMIDNDLFAEYDEYSKNRLYGTLKTDYADGDKVVVLTPNGLRQLRRSFPNSHNIFSVLVEAGLGTRIKRYINRCGASFNYEDKNEIASRVDRDWSMFLGVNREVDMVVHNEDDCDIEELARNIIKHATR
jgi:guanylate kinase